MRDGGVVSFRDNDLFFSLSIVYNPSVTFFESDSSLCTKEPLICGKFHNITLKPLFSCCEPIKKFRCFSLHPMREKFASKFGTVGGFSAVRWKEPAEFDIFDKFGVTRSPSVTFFESDSFLPEDAFGLQ